MLMYACTAATIGNLPSTIGDFNIWYYDAETEEFICPECANSGKVELFTVEEISTGKQEIACYSNGQQLDIKCSHCNK